MKPESAASAYQEAVLDNAPPLKIVHLLYEGALRFLDQAERLDPKEDQQAFSEKLNRADAIVSELRISLDHEPAPEVSEKLDALYLFAEERIRTAFLERTKEPIGEAKEVLTTLLDAWKQVEVDAQSPQA